ncbi:MAG: hypothetical protein Q9187_004329 [Circinaria calcarea]
MASKIRTLEIPPYNITRNGALGYRHFVEDVFRHNRRNASLMDKAKIDDAYKALVYTLPKHKKTIALSKILDGKCFNTTEWPRKYCAQEIKIPNKAAINTARALEIDGQVVQLIRVFGKLDAIKQHHYIRFASQDFPKVNPHLSGIRRITDSAWKATIEPLAQLTGKGQKGERAAVALVSTHRNSCPSLVKTKQKHD